MPSPASVPLLTVALLLTIGLFYILGPPLIALITSRKNHFSLLPVLVGSVAYLLLFLVLQDGLDRYLMKPRSPFYNAMVANPPLYMIYSGSLYALFQEGGLFLALTFLKKKYSAYAASVSIWLGYNAIQALLAVGVPFLIRGVQSINNNIQILAGLSEDPALVGALAEVSRMQPIYLLWMFYEYLLLFGIHLGLISLCWLAGTKSGASIYLGAAMILRIIFYTPFALRTVAVINSKAVFYIALSIFALVSVIIAIFVFRSAKRTQEKDADPFSLF